MPNRTIYVADADLPTFEKAQQLAGENLSATIVQALRHFIEAEEARMSGYYEIMVEVGKGQPYLQKKFRGRSLARRRLIMNKTRILTLEIYQTAKGRFALYSRNSSNRDWSNNTQQQEEGDTQTTVGKWTWKWGSVWDWSGSSSWTAEYASEERRLDVFENLEALKGAIPEEMYESVVHYLQHGDEAEFLDI